MSTRRGPTAAPGGGGMTAAPGGGGMTAAPGGFNWNTYKATKKAGLTAAQTARRNLYKTAFGIQGSPEQNFNYIQLNEGARLSPYGLNAYEAAQLGLLNPEEEHNWGYYGGNYGVLSPGKKTYIGGRGVSVLPPSFYNPSMAAPVENPGWWAATKGFFGRSKKVAPPAMTALPGAPAAASTAASTVAASSGLSPTASRTIATAASTGARTSPAAAGAAAGAAATAAGAPPAVAASIASAASVAASSPGFWTKAGKKAKNAMTRFGTAVGGLFKRNKFVPVSAAATTASTRSGRTPPVGGVPTAAPDVSAASGHSALLARRAARLAGAPVAPIPVSGIMTRSSPGEITRMTTGAGSVVPLPPGIRFRPSAAPPTGRISPAAAAAGAAAAGAALAAGVPAPAAGGIGAAAAAAAAAPPAVRPRLPAGLAAGIKAGITTRSISPAAAAAGAAAAGAALAAGVPAPAAGGIGAAAAAAAAARPVGRRSSPAAAGGLLGDIAAAAAARNARVAAGGVPKVPVRPAGGGGGGIGAMLASNPKFQALGAARKGSSAGSSAGSSTGSPYWSLE